MNYIRLNLPPSKEDLELAQAMIDSKTGIRRISIDATCKNLFKFYTPKSTNKNRK